jgi:hypothetical protein
MRFISSKSIWMETIKMDSSNIQKLEAQLEEIVRGSNADKDYNATKP